MKRLVPLGIALVLAVGLAFAVSGDRDPAGVEARAEVERRLQAKDVEGARRVAAECRERVPAWVARSLDATIALAAGDDAGALAAADEAFRMDPAAAADWRVTSVRFFARINTGAIDDAGRVIDEWIAAHPDDERGHHAAARYWIEARTADPDPERALRHLGLVEAIQRKGAAADPGDATAVREEEVTRLRSLAERMRGALFSAVAEAEARVKLAPGDADAHAQLGEVLRIARKGDAARAAWREAVRLAPEDPVWARQLALLLLDDAGAAPEVEALTARIVAASPDDPSALILQARALVRAHRPDDPSDPRIERAIDIYRSLRTGPLAAKLTVAQRAEICRNLAVALYDWEQGGQPGEYLNEAHVLLAEYLSLGGRIDLRLADIWEKLEARARAQGAGPR